MNEAMIKKLISMSLITSLFAGPAFGAESANQDYGKLCGQGAAISDTTKTYCAQADVARTTESFQKKKEIMMMAAGVTLTALGLLPFGSGQPACKPIALATDIAGIGINVAQSISEKKINTSMMSGLSSVGALGIQTNIFQNEIANKLESKIAEHIPNRGLFSDGNKMKGECLVSAGLAFVQGAFAMSAVSSAKKAENSALSSVSSVEAASTSNGFVIGTAAALHIENTGSSGSAGSASAADCSNTSGNATLKCMSKSDPQVAAITADTSLMGHMQSALSGKSLGDLVNGYKGDGSTADASKYVGDALGMGSSNAAALKGAVDTAGQLANAEAYTGAKYVVNGGKQETGSGDVDFNKMMSGMLGKLGPEASDKAASDPSSLVFRQLDLLSPDKIAANKDISLFARIGYRYRKQSSNVDQLNSATATTINSNSAGRVPANNP